MARRIQDSSGLRRFSFVSTVAVAGKRENEVVTGRLLPSIGIVPTTIPTRAQKNSASTWCTSCCPTCRKLFSVRALFWAIRATAQQLSSTWSAHSFSGRPACASPAPRRSHRNCARGLRRKSHRHCSTKKKNHCTTPIIFLPAPVPKLANKLRTLSQKNPAKVSRSTRHPGENIHLDGQLNRKSHRQVGTQRRPSKSFLTVHLLEHRV